MTLQLSFANYLILSGFLVRCSNTMQHAINTFRWYPSYRTFFEVETIVKGKRVSLMWSKFSIHIYQTTHLLKIGFIFFKPTSWTFTKVEHFITLHTTQCFKKGNYLCKIVVCLNYYWRLNFFYLYNTLVLQSNDND